MNTIIDLNGLWALGWFDGQRGGGARLLNQNTDLSHTLEAQVPGSVHLDLIRCGLLAEPTTGLNALAARWVEETLWSYRRTFTAPALAPGQHAWLRFDGLDLAAKISLNGKEIAQHANAFYPCLVDVTNHMREGENLLVVSIEAGLFSVTDRKATGYNMTPDSLLHKRNWLRKTQSSFGWDWSTRLLNVGITGGVRLEIAERARFDRLVVLSTLSDEMRRGTVTARIFAEGLADAPQQGTLVVEIAETGQRIEASVQVKPGINPVEVTLQVEAPKLWWPINHGEQPLYTVTASLSIDGKIIGRDMRKVGFRKVRVNQEPHPDMGSYFIIEINDRPIFCKGGNFVPAEMILARLDRDRYTALVDLALEANFNLLRVWGGGLYESSDFYEICDERGVLVWQEFIYACAKYPIQDEQFLIDVQREAVYQMRRLAHHPSLIVWCGNNEMEVGNYEWGYDRGVAYPDYALFHMLLPRILQSEDGTRYYQPSSPFSPDLAAPNADKAGDQHPWSVGFANTDFRDYRKMISRFPNEGGTLGPSALPTVKACLLPGQEYPNSFSFQFHDNGIAFWGDYCYPDAMLQQWLGLDIAKLGIEEYVYYGGIVHGQGLTEYIRNFRRRMFNSASAIFWMYNDCWPTTRSWTIVDYYLRRTPAFHPVRRAFQPVISAIAIEEGKVKVFGINEGPEWRGVLRSGLFALTGGYPIDKSQEVTLPANASTLLAEFDEREWEQAGVNTHGAFAILSQNGKEISRDVFFLPFYKEMQWPKPALRVRQEHGKAIFESDTFTFRVCLDLDGERAFPDNFFDVLPGIPTVLDWPDELGEVKVLHTGNL